MIRKKIPASEKATISESELVVLKVLWQSGPLKVSDVLTALESQGYAWVYNTVQTLLNRLKDKKYVTAEKQGRALTYGPLINRDTFIQRKMEAVASQVFDGATTPLVMALVEQQQFSKTEIQQFKALLDRLDQEAGQSEG